VYIHYRNIGLYVTGNFKTQIVSNVFDCIGMGLLLFSTWQLFHVSHGTNPTPTPAIMNITSTNDRTLDLTLASVGLLLIAVGFGQLSAVQSVFVGDQFSDTQQEAKKHSFSWFYLFLNVGSLLAEAGAPILRQTFNFFICYSTMAGAVILSTIFYFFGLPYYRKVAPSRKKTVITNASTEAAQDLLRHDTGSSSDDEEQNDSLSMNRCSKLISNVRQLQGIIKVFTPLVVYWMLFYQQNSTWVLQGGRMNCYFGRLHVPPDLMPSFNDVLVILFIPLLDYCIYPHIEQVMGIKVKPLHKIGAGMVCAALAFVLAGLLELYIEVPEVDCKGDVSIAWQVPQYILISFAEVLVAVTGLEFAYSQAPEHLRFDIRRRCPVYYFVELFFFVPVHMQKLCHSDVVHFSGFGYRPYGWYSRNNNS
jgi:POT family proton-dependent oligopeptide transporter